MKQEINIINNCYQRAIEALEYLAQNPRPSGGNERFNSECLFQIARELELSLVKSCEETNLENKMNENKIPFDNLSSEEKEFIKQQILLGKVEVNCPWWNEDHWEDKIGGFCFAECFYRLKPSIEDK